MPRRSLPRSTHLRGIVLVTVGTLCLVPDATLVRLVEAGDLEIVFWRSLFIAAALAVVITLRHGRATSAAFRTIGLPGLAVGFLWGVQFVLFVVAVEHTAVANALVILSTGPFFAAFFSRVLLGEAVRLRTWGAMAAASGGIMLTFASAVRVGGLAGNAAALAVAASLGLNLTVIRGTERVDMLPAVSVAGVIGAAIALPAAWPLGIAAGDALPLVLMGLVFVPAALALVTAGTRYLPAPEVSLLMVLETVFGPLVAWAVIAERPPAFAAAGGAVVVVALLAHSSLALREERPLGAEVDSCRVR